MTRTCRPGVTMASGKQYAVDTSVAVAALDSTHTAHESCVASVRRYRPKLAGHAAFEVFSVLTRMPGQLSVDPVVAARLMERVFGVPVWLESEAADELLRRLPVVGIAGGSVYDALVGEAARRNGLVLLTRDHRARRTYDLLGAEYELIDP